ncbi:hypothetical protein [Hyphomicrobium sp. CS1GBMeth3]|uniref:hypothetical protein n=1 Tax=Hyphomicrobium sp. CS1GBMeth3 TaxID=1892845 RepID=UPI0009320664|nr:hypothetical protein [Hyphomicrobium sp. CS1GBMeth3]
MDQDREHRDALAAAGHTGPVGTVLFCSLLAVIGALFGSVALAILWSLAVPANTQAENTVLGIASGVALGIWIGLIKIRRGNLEAREEVEDRAWRRLARHQQSDRMP